MSTISQIAGALTNIILDYVFIFPLDMGVSGAAWATIIGQFVSLFVAMMFHYFTNKEINGSVKYIRPSVRLIKQVYSIGLSAALMQALLSIMMAGVNKILGMANASSAVLVGAFGIYYKIQQIALFSAFGLSNTIITVLSFNYGMMNKPRSLACVKYGIIDTIFVTAFITIVFEICAKPLSMLFSLSGSSSSALVDVCTVATRIGSIGFIFMGFSVAVQGVLQSLGYAIKPLIIAALRLIVFVFPIAYIFTLSGSVLDIVWWTFPISEAATCVFSLLFLKKAYKLKIKPMDSE